MNDTSVDFVGEPLTLTRATILQRTKLVDKVVVTHELNDDLVWLRNHNLIDFVDNKYELAPTGFEVLTVIGHLQQAGEQFETIIRAFLFNKRSYSFKWSRTKEVA